ncbi:nucleoside ABC transporter ATP-binding protein [Anaerolinea thermolimosa]|uniref:Nucleoside ABC transporter ATP-binding protein n=1 Tax=Anaerolinea thermolimosa TaxID=229919 RepID=A0A7U9KMA8_9CHLR|nr:ABC transporter ATP-binding protein [Anaerolinea thermolimosa]GAP08489.1 nucleoside ABC transporter ATP-binding protein [Anaerolinea thermolimosa]
MPPVLELKGITKRFPGVLANDHIDLTLNEGEILALLGENGAGKSTLMNILYGLYQPDEGEVFIRGEKITIHSPIDAIRAGIGMVHQHFMLIPVFTVTENIMLGAESVRMGDFLDRPAAAARIREISSRYGLEVDPNAYVRDLPVGVQQRVEIIKLLYREANILIFDEPTAVLTPQEADELFVIMRELARQGKSIIFITHKLREVLDVADRIMVIRRGAVVGETVPAQADRQTLAAMMVGREVRLEVEKRIARAGDVVLEVHDLVVTDAQKQITVDGVSFDVRAGEILGVAGVQGNGQTELVEAVTGLRQPVSGSIRLLGQDVTRATPREIIELGTAHVPEDRQRDGLVLSFPVAENIVLCTYYKPPFARGVQLQREIIYETANRLIADFDIRTPSASTTVGSLSGGNQQKVIIAREFSRPIHLLVASQPTRGLDVGSIEYIHQRIVQKRDEGCAVLLVSPELDEVMELSDRIAVMYRGKIVAIVPAESATKSYIGLLMAGVSPEQAGAPQEGERIVESTF